MYLNRLESGLLAVILTSAAIFMAVAGGSPATVQGGRPEVASSRDDRADVNAAPARLQSIAGPVAADVVEIVDGDNVRVIAHVWPGHAVSVNVRLRGIDTPELRSPCAAERKLAGEAKAALAGLLGGGPVLLVNVAGGKYFGRVVADLRLADGSDLATLMLRTATARPYDGGRRRPWCS